MGPCGALGCEECLGRKDCVVDEIGRCVNRTRDASGWSAHVDLSDPDESSLRLGLPGECGFTCFALQQLGASNYLPVEAPATCLSCTSIPWAGADGEGVWRAPRLATPAVYGGGVDDTRAFFLSSLSCVRAGVSEEAFRGCTANLTNFDGGTRPSLLPEAEGHPSLRSCLPGTGAPPAGPVAAVAVFAAAAVAFFAAGWRRRECLRSRGWLIPVLGLSALQFLVAATMLGAATGTQPKVVAESSDTGSFAYTLQNSAGHKGELALPLLGLLASGAALTILVRLWKPARLARGNLADAAVSSLLRVAFVIHAACMLYYGTAAVMRAHSLVNYVRATSGGSNSGLSMSPFTLAVGVGFDARLYAQLAVSTTSSILLVLLGAWYFSPGMHAPVGTSAAAFVKSWGTPRAHLALACAYAAAWWLAAAAALWAWWTWGTVRMLGAVSLHVTHPLPGMNWLGLPLAVLLLVTLAPSPFCAEPTLTAARDGTGAAEALLVAAPREDVDEDTAKHYSEALHALSPFVTAGSAAVLYLTYVTYSASGSRSPEHTWRAYALEMAVLGMFFVRCALFQLALSRPRGSVARMQAVAPAAATGSITQQAREELVDDANEKLLGWLQGASSLVRRAARLGTSLSSWTNVHRLAIANSLLTIAIMSYIAATNGAASGGAVVLIVLSCVALVNSAVAILQHRHPSLKLLPSDDSYRFMTLLKASKVLFKAQLLSGSTTSTAQLDALIAPLYLLSALVLAVATFSNAVPLYRRPETMAADLRRPRLFVLAFMAGYAASKIILVVVGIGSLGGLSSTLSPTLLHDVLPAILFVTSYVNNEAARYFDGKKLELVAVVAAEEAEEEEEKVEAEEKRGGGGGTSGGAPVLGASFSVTGCVAVEKLSWAVLLISVLTTTVLAAESEGSSAPPYTFLVPLLWIVRSVLFTLSQTGGSS